MRKTQKRSIQRDVSRKAPAIALALLGALGGGCSKKDNPVTAYGALVMSVEKGEYPKAYEVLSAPTRHVLEARARQLHADTDGGVRDDPATLFFSANTQVAAPETSGSCSATSAAPRSGCGPAAASATW